MAETKSVCVEEWLNCYLSTLNEKEQKEIQTVKSDTEFNFGMEKMFFFFRNICFNSLQNCRKKCNCRNRDYVIPLNDSFKDLEESQLTKVLLKTDNITRKCNKK